MLYATVNIWAVLVSAILSMIIGGFWYSPALFGNVWMKLVGLSKKDIEAAKKKGMAVNYVINFIGALVMAYVLANFLNFAEASNVWQGIGTAFWIWLGFMATTSLGMLLWEGKPFKLYALNNSYYLIMLIIMSVILVLWI